jgi:hypothetical protein
MGFIELFLKNIFYINVFTRNNIILKLMFWVLSRRIGSLIIAKKDTLKVQIIRQDHFLPTCQVK